MKNSDQENEDEINSDRFDNSEEIVKNYQNNELYTSAGYSEASTPPNTPQLEESLYESARKTPNKLCSRSSFSCTNSSEEIQRQPGDYEVSATSSPIQICLFENNEECRDESVELSREHSNNTTCDLADGNSKSSNTRKLDKSVFDSSCKNPVTPLYSNDSLFNNSSSSEIRTSTNAGYESSSMYAKDQIAINNLDGSVGLSISKYFAVHKLIATGSFSTVYKCQNYMDGIFYAVKKYSLTSNEWEKQLLACSTLRYKYIERYHTCWREDNYFCFQMEFCNYGNVEQRINNGFIFSELNMIKLVKHLCRGLSYIHELKFIHCNLTPSNILITGVQYYETLKNLEIGVAYKISGFSKITKNETEDKSIKNVLIRDDLYNLGIVLLKAATGRDFCTSYENGNVRYIDTYSDIINDIIHNLLISNSENKLNFRYIISNCRFAKHKVKRQMT